MASPNFRLKKISDVVGKFRVRRAILKNQLEQPEFQSETTKEFIQGQIAALDVVMQDLFMEFDIEHPDRIDEPKRKREVIELMIQDGHVKEGAELAEWRDMNKRHWGWNGWLRKNYPVLADKYKVHDNG